MIEAVLICTILAMSDGDSGRCTTQAGERVRVRLAGIDAPEVAPFTRCRTQPEIWACSTRAAAFGVTAQARARQLTASGARCTVTDRDRWGRVVARCTVNEHDLGSIMVREGLAISESNFGDPYRREERAARADHLGVWR